MLVKNITLTTLLCLFGLLIGCKKDTPAENESPFFSFFEEKAILIDTVAQAADTWEYGFKFSPSKTGKVSQIGVKLPEVGSVAVTLWALSDAGAPKVLKSTFVYAAEVHEAVFSDISDITLEKGEHYGLTILANSFYRLTKSDNSSFAFPRTVGSIVVESFNESINNTGMVSFPASTNDTRVAPCVDVIFIAD